MTNLAFPVSRAFLIAVLANVSAAAPLNPMRPHQPHPSLLRDIHAAVSERRLLLPQRLLDVGLLGAGDPGFFPVGWAVVAG